MQIDFRSVLAGSALALGVAQASAATSVGEYFTFSGFGTTAVTVTDNDGVDFVRYGQPKGATEDPDFEVDSNLGLQLNARANAWLSGTVQLLTMQKYEENLETNVEWAFVAVEPVDGLRLRLGRMAMPTFAISDTRNVGYANTWIRPPSEVYGLSMMENLDGGDLSYYLPFGSSAVTLTVLAGEGSAYGADGSEVDLEDVRGAAAQLDTKWATFRVSRIKADSLVSKIGFPTDDEYTFNNVGVFVDRNDVLMRAEYVTRSSDGYPEFVDSEGWYAFGGYRFGSVVPYAMVAKAEPTEDFTLASEQSTVSAGVRWDAFGSAAIKFQVDRVDPHDTYGINFVSDQLFAPVDGETTVATLAVDFIF